MKYCIIRKVPFRTPSPKSRIVWGNVLCECYGICLVLVPKLDSHGSHKLFIATENVAERHFEPVTPHYFLLESEDLILVGDKLRMLGKSFEHDDFIRHFSSGEFP